MSNNNNNGGLLASIGNAILLIVIFLIAGFMFHIVWLLVKIPMWITSPHRGGLETTEEDVLKISFRRMMWTPYSLGMMVSSGFTIIFTWALVIAYKDPNSLVYSSDKSAYYLLLTLIAFGLMPTLYMMAMEIRMILSFEGWYNSMIKKNRNPLA